jgi:hypothetical protein
MPNASKPANYVKLTAFGPSELYDSDAVSLPPTRDRQQPCAVSWVYPFTGKVEGAVALAQAQAKRAELAAAFPDLPFDDAFQLSTFKSSPLRGVPVQGVSVRRLPLEIQEAAE